jgi:glycosidase
MESKIISKIISEMISYYSGDVRRINHFLKVHSFAKTIGELENINEDELYILEIAAVVHDIGIKASEQKYNSSAGNYQELEGPEIARQLLQKLSIDNNIIERVCYLVGHHHTYADIDKIDFQILVEADFIVNIFEDNIKEINLVKNKYFKTETGINFVEKLYELKTEEKKVEDIQVKKHIRKDISEVKDWANQSLFYHIYPLGFCGAPQFNDWGSESTPRIKKVIEWIPHLKELGINAVYFGPIFESTEHGYDTADYRIIDRRLGTNDDFKEVCLELHKNQIKVVVDGEFNHVGRDFWAFKDIQEKKQGSQYLGWFENLNFGGSSPMGDPFWYEGWEGHYNLVKLNLKNRDLVNHLFSAIEMWMDEFKIDGIRLDVAYCMDENFFRELHNFCKSKRDDFWLMGEMVHGDYARLTKPGMLDSVTNYECYKGIYSSHNDKNYFEIAYSLNRQFGNGGMYKNIHTYNFVDNHDVNRLMSTLKNEQDVFNVYTLLYTMPGIPSIYYGSEWGIHGAKANGSDAHLRPELNLENIKNDKILRHIKKLGEIHNELPSLYYGEYEQVLIRNEQFAFKRRTAEETSYILLNLSESEFIFNFNVNGASKLEDVLGDNEVVEVNNGNACVCVKPHSAKILR